VRTRLDGQDDEFVILVYSGTWPEWRQSLLRKRLLQIMHLPAEIAELAETPRIVRELWMGMLLVGGIAALGFGIYFHRQDKARRAQRREERRQARRAARLKRR